MKKNVAGQSVGVTMITAADGTAFTGAASVFVTLDNGTQTAAAGTAPVHEGNGYHSYTPTQAETNAEHIAFTFTGTGASPATEKVYTTFPQTGDNFTRLGLPIDTDIATDVANVQSSVSDLAASPGVGARPFVPTNITVVAGTNASGTAEDMANEDANVYTINDAAGTLTLDLDYQLESDTDAIQYLVTAAAQGGGDDIAIQLFDQVGLTWVTIDTVVGANALTERIFDKVIVAKYTSTEGLFQVRYTGTGLTSATLTINKAVTYGITTVRTVGYANGAIWIDTNTGTDGMTPFINGTADNPVLTWANVVSLVGSTGIRRIQVAAGSAIILTGNSDNYYITGQAYTLDFNGQSIDGLFAFGANISGAGTSAGNRPIFEDCPVFDVTLPPSIMRRCFFAGTVTANGAGEWYFNHCTSRVPAPGSPVFDFNGFINTIKTELYAGGFRVENMTAADNFTIDGFGGFTEGTCTGGDVTLRGSINQSGVTNITVDNRANTADSMAKIQGSTFDSSTDALDVVSARVTRLAGLAVNKNEAFSNFEFLMVLSSDHVTPAIGLSLSGQRSIDGGAFAPVAGVIAEVGSGVYQFDALAADTNGDLITWRFTSATADDAFITFKTI